MIWFCFALMGAKRLVFLSILWWIQDLDARIASQTNLQLTSLCKIQFSLSLSVWICLCLPWLRRIFPPGFLCGRPTLDGSLLWESVRWQMTFGFVLMCLRVSWYWASSVSNTQTGAGWCMNHRNFDSLCLWQLSSWRTREFCPRKPLQDSATSC